MEMHVIEVTGDVNSSIGSIAINGSPLMFTNTITYGAGTSTAGDTELVLVAGTAGPTLPTFAEPRGFTLITNSGAWGLAGAYYDVNIAAGPFP